MDDAALQVRLDAIERRQYAIIALIVLPYVVGAVGVVVGSVGVESAMVGGLVAVVVVFAAFVVYGYQANRS
jgi:hypothetical protein